MVSILGLRGVCKEGPCGKVELLLILGILVISLAVLQALASWMLDGSIIVKVIEAKRISDRIASGELDTVEKIGQAWNSREKSSLVTWFIKRVKKTIKQL